MQKRKQKLYESEKQILEAIETNATKLATKVQMMEQEEKASRELAKEAGRWDGVARCKPHVQCRTGQLHRVSSNWERHLTWVRINDTAITAGLAG